MKLIKQSICCFLLLVIAKVSGAELPSDLTPLIRFYDNNRFVHSYSHDERELADWRQTNGVREQIVVGMISTKELPGTSRLWRAVRQKDQKHFYYLTAPRPAVGVIVDNDNFQTYVWKTSGNGRIPIYGSTWTDATDVFFDAKLSDVKKYAADTKKALGVDRKMISASAVFWVYPNPEKEAEKSK